MMDYIRTHATSWGVKIAFIIIIAVFVFWGVGSFRSTPEGTIVTVNGQAITRDMFSGALDQAVDNFRARQPGVSRDELEAQGLRFNVLNEMVERILIQEEAKRTGIRVSPAEIRAVIVSQPFLWNESGVFDKSRYELFLANNRLTAQAYEGLVRDELLQSKVFSAVMGAADVSDAEMNLLFDFVAEQRAIDYVLFKVEDYTKDLVPDPARVEAIYEEARPALQVPATLDVRYLLLDAGTLANRAEIDDAAIADFYEKNAQSRYQMPERVHLRHIQVNVSALVSEDSARAKIEQAAAALAAGKDFAKVAEEFSEDTVTASKGGDLGWFAREGLNPVFQNVFDQAVGTRSEPLRTAVGFQIIQVVERQEAHVAALADVRDNIRAVLADTEAQRRLPALAEEVQVMIESGRTLDEIAVETGFLTRTTGAQTRENIAAATKLSMRDVNMLFALPSGAPLSTPMESDAGYLFAQILESKPASVRPLDEVRGIMESAAITEEGVRLAGEAADAARASFVDGQIPDEYAARLVQAAAFTRNALDAGPGFSPDLVQAAFAAEAAEMWLPGIFTTQNGAVIARVRSITPPSEADRQKDFAAFQQQRLAERQEKLIGLFVAKLFSEAEIREFDLTPVMAPQQR